MSKIKKIAISIPIIITLLVSSSVIAFAVTPMWFLCDKPQITNTSAYVEVVDGSGKGYVFYLIGSDGTNTVSSNVNLGFRCSIDSDGYLYFKVDEDLVQNGFTCHSFYVNQGNQVSATPYWSEGGYSYIRLYSISYIMGYNCDVSAVPTSYNDYSFYYSGDVIISDKLNTISDILRSVNSNITTQSEATRAKLNEILTYCIYQNSNLEKIVDEIKKGNTSIIDNANNNANAIQDNNDKNTQSIIDNQNQLAEQEKTETQNSGDKSVNDVSSSVPDKSAGMLSALQSLSNAVSYTGTVAKWKFPQMYIPAISGVTDRINLNSEMEIDFTYWVNQIPKDIRTVISALATIGLIIFAFKELYGLISYVLTLKGGGNNE